MRVRKKICDNDIAISNIVNLTSFVDLLFSLLIIFIVSGQNLFGGISLEIPKGKAEIVVVKKDPIAVFIKSDGTIFVNDEETKFNKIPQVISELTMKDYSTKIFVLGDKNNLYGRIISVVDVLNSAGFLDVVLVTDLSNNLTKEIEQNKNN